MNWIKENQQNLKELMNAQGLDALYVGSGDRHLNEYVPLDDCLRYLITGFTGSTAESLILKDGSVFLYVDGRYFEQVDQEVPSDIATSIKVSLSGSIRQSLLEDIGNKGIKNLGLFAERSSVHWASELARHCDTLVPLADHQGTFTRPDEKRASTLFTDSFKTDASYLYNESPRDWAKKWVGDDEAYWLSSLDLVSWFCQFRKYALPFQSAGIARALVSKNDITLFAAPEDSEGLDKLAGINLKVVPYKDLERALQESASLYQGLMINYHPAETNMSEKESLGKVFGDENLKANSPGLRAWQTIKTPEEIEGFKDSAIKSSKAVAHTFKWLISKWKDESPSEVDFSNKILEEYKNQGAIGASFNPIPGIGENSSIIHYGRPNPEKKAVEGDLALLDSGAYYEWGLATDITRAMYIGDNKPSGLQKEIYTLVLKGLIQCSKASFPKGTKGSFLDVLARKDMLAKGMNFNHGTGHGIGLNVHEWGYSISTQSKLPLQVGQVGSIEPGIYIPGEGGVRLENMAVVIEDPDYPENLTFRPLSYVGFDHRLIERDWLDNAELLWLEAYEAECEKLGTSFR